MTRSLSVRALPAFSAATVHGVYVVGRVRRVVPVLLMGLMAGLLQACASLAPYAYTPDDLRQAVQDRVPGISPEDIVVLHQVSPEAVERARELVPNSRPDDRLMALLDALSDPEGFGLRYRWARTADASRTLELGEGNCLGSHR